jgi:ketosteroid isomerase-like protein
MPALRSYLATFFMDSLFTVSFQPVMVEVSDDASMGYTMNNAALTYTGPDGKAATEKVRDFHVWRRQKDGSWKLLVDIWNSEPVAVKP